MELAPIQAITSERGRRPSFFLTFTAVYALVALVLSVVVGLAVTIFLAREIRAKVIDEVAQAVSEVTAPLLASRLEQTKAPLSGYELATFDRFVRDNLLTARTGRITLWNQDGVIIYSTQQPLIGTTLVNEGVTAALSGSTTAAVESVGDAPDQAGLDGMEKVIEVYAPLQTGDPPQTVGALEVYQDYAPIAAFESKVTTSVFLGVAAALAVLYLALLLLVRHGSDLIRRQEADLGHEREQLLTSYESIVSVLCSALDLRDQVTHGHAQPVGRLAAALARQMGLRKQEVRSIEKAAILHDIGKIGVADAILTKAGALTEAEWAEMKRHPELGRQMLQGIEFLQDAAEIVYAHHERFDGKGYPRGLKGEEIPLGARILAVVGAYDAMTSYRPYRRPVPHKEAVQEILRHSWTQFDPQVVNVFLEMDRRGLLPGEAGLGDAQGASVSSVETGVHLS